MFKKMITAVIIALNVLSVSQIYASDLDWFESIFSDINDEFNCTYINREMTHYPKYKKVIDSYFRKVSTKNISTQRKIYKKFDDLATRKLTTINKNTQAKLYAVIGYIKCEAEKENKLFFMNHLKINYGFKEERETVKNTYGGGTYERVRLFLLKNEKKIFITESYTMYNIKIDNRILYYEYEAATGQLVWASYYIDTWKTIYDYNLSKGKKWTFIKYIWWWVEARQNSLYTYFYYEDRLFNTVRNVVNDDSVRIFWIREYSLDDFDTESFREKKLDLYSAKIVSRIGATLIEFTKETNLGDKVYFYDIEWQKWED